MMNNMTAREIGFPGITSDLRLKGFRSLTIILGLRNFEEVTLVCRHLRKLPALQALTFASKERWHAYLWVAKAMKTGKPLLQSAVKKLVSLKTCDLKPPGDLLSPYHDECQKHVDEVMAVVERKKGPQGKRG